MQDEILLAIDGSTKSTGYAIFKNKQLIDHGVITATGSNLFYRIEKVTFDLEEIVNKYNPTRVALEEVLPDDVHHNQQVYKALTYLQGFIRDMLNKYTLDAELIPASHWRKICNIKTGRGVRRESLKKSDVLFVKSKYNIDVNDDEADAICIGYAIIYEKNLPSNDIDDFEFR